MTSLPQQEPSSKICHVAPPVILGGELLERVAGVKSLRRRCASYEAAAALAHAAPEWGARAAVVLSLVTAAIGAGFRGLCAAAWELAELAECSERHIRRIVRQLVAEGVLQVVPDYDPVPEGWTQTRAGITKKWWSKRRRNLYTLRAAGAVPAVTEQPASSEPAAVEKRPVDKLCITCDLPVIVSAAPDKCPSFRIRISGVDLDLLEKKSEGAAGAAPSGRGPAASDPAAVPAASPCSEGETLRPTSDRPHAQDSELLKGAGAAGELLDDHDRVALHLALLRLGVAGDPARAARVGFDELELQLAAALALPWPELLAQVVAAEARLAEGAPRPYTRALAALHVQLPPARGPAR